MKYEQRNDGELGWEAFKSCLLIKKNRATFWRHDLPPITYIFLQIKRDRKFMDNNGDQSISPHNSK